MKRTGRLMAIGGMVVLLALFFVSAQVLGASPEVQITYPDERVFVKETDTTLTVKFMHTSLEGYTATAAVQLIRSGATAPVLNDTRPLGQGTGEPVEVQHDLSFTAPLEEGKYTVRVRLNNILLLEDLQSAEDSEELVYADYTPPVISLNPAPASPTHNRRPTWSWTVTDAMTDIKKVQVSFDDEDDGAWEEIESSTSILSTLYDFSYTPSDDLPYGIYKLFVKAIDEADNERIESFDPVEITQDPAPEPPELVLLTPGRTNKPQVWTWTWPAGALEFELGWSQSEGDEPSGENVVQVGAFDTYTTDLQTRGDGTYYVRVRAIAEDLIGDWSAPVSVVIDTTPPTLPSAWVITPTTNKTPTWSWTEIAEHDEPGVGYEVLLDDLEVFDVAKALSFTPSATLSDGEHTLKVRSYDDLGNTTDWASCPSVLVVVDTAPPEAPGIRPMEPGYNSTPITISWTSVTDGDNPISYELQIARTPGFPNPTIVNTDDTEYEFSPPGERQYWVRVKAISTVNAGTDPIQTKESGWSPVVSFAYDITPPEAPALTLETSSPTNQSPQRWSWSTPEGAVGFKVSVDGGAWEDVGNRNTYETEFDETGTYSFSVMAYDWLGNESQDNAAEGTVEVDLEPPVVPTAPEVVSPTTDTTPKWTWWLGDGVEDPSIAGFEVLLDDFIIDVGNRYSWEHSETLGGGWHSLRVRSYDDLGNRSDWSDEAWVYVDTSPVPVPAIEPLKAAYNASGVPIAIRWNDVVDGYRDRDEEEVFYPISYVLEWADNAGFSGASREEGLATASWVFTPTAEGQYWFRVKAVATVNEDEGETKESQWSPVVSFAYDTTPPAVPQMNSLPEHTNAYSINITWTPVIGAEKYHLRYQIGSQEIDVVECTVPSYTLDITSAANNDVVWAKARAVDAAGNASDYALAVQTIVDREAPTVAIDPMESPTANPRPRWTWSAEYTGAPVAHYLVSLDFYPAIETDSESYYPSSDLSSISHVLMVIAVDEAGNWSAPAVSVVEVDITPPPVPGMPHVIGPDSAPVYVTNNPTPTWTWSPSVAADFSHYKVYADGVEVVMAEPLTTNSYTSAELSHGPHILEVTAVDMLGNESERSPQGQVFIDTQAPPVPEMGSVDEYSKPGEIEFSWSVSDDDFQVEYIFQYSLNYTTDDETQWTTVDGLNKQSFMVDASSAAHGAAVAGRVMARDASGNESGYSAAVWTTIDRVVPTVTIDGPSGRVGSTTLVWTWIADGTGSPIDHYRVSLDLEPPFKTDQPLYVALGLSHGGHLLRVWAIDAAGNEGYAQVTVEVDIEAPPVPGMPMTSSPTNDTTPTWTWAWDEESEPGDFSHFNVYLDGVKVNEDDEVKQPTYTIPDELALSDGLHVLQVTAVDDLGNESGKSIPGHIVVDTVPPAIPVVRSLPEYTNAEELTVEWTAVPTAHSYKVEYAIGSNEGTTLSYVPSVTISLAGAVEGDVVEVRVMAIDEAGNESEYSEPVRTIFDDIPPVVTFNAMPSRTRDARPQWQWSATYSVAPVEYYWVSLDIWPAFQTISDRYSHGSDLSDGPHTLTVIAVDAAGNWSTLVWSTVEVDTTVSVPGMPTTASPTNNTKPTWTWPAVTDEDLAHYRVYLDGEFIGTVESNVFTAENYVRDGEPFELSDGLHVTEVTAVDDLGNESARSTAGHVFVDLEAPAIPIMKPLPPYTKDESVTLVWTAVESAVRYRVRYSVGGVDAEAEVMASPVQTVELPIPLDDTEDGDVVTARVRARDEAGNWSAFSDPVSTMIDRTPPVVTIETPDSPTNNPRPRWTWEGVDDTSDVAFYIVQLDDEPEFMTMSEVYEPASNLADGGHVLRVKAVDLAGNIGDDWTVSGSVVVDTTPPAVPGIPEPEASPTNNTTPTWTWKASEGAASYNVYLDDELIANVAEPEFIGPDDYITFGVSPLTEGVHHLQVTAVDEVYNESDMSGTGHVVIDLTPPPVPVMKPLPEFTNADSVTLEWTAVDSAIRYRVRYSIGSAEAEEEVAGTSVPIIERSIGDATDGDVVTARVRARDEAGNWSAFSDPVSTIIDRTGPTTEPDGTDLVMVTNNARPTLKWKADDGAGCGLDHFIVTLNGQPQLPTTGTEYTPAHDLAVGTHTLKVQAVDKLGNVGNELVFEVQVLEPIVIDVNPLEGSYPINRISTIMVILSGMEDAQLEVAVSGEWLGSSSIIEISREAGIAKFYVLLDDAVMKPGRLLLMVKAGITQQLFQYEVLNERSGFGFGRLRPW